MRKESEIAAEILVAAEVWCTRKDDAFGTMKGTCSFHFCHCRSS